MSSAAIGCALVASACSGTIGADAEPDGGIPGVFVTAGGVAPGGTLPPAATPGATETAGTSAPGAAPVGAGGGGLRRLTNLQYRNSVRDLLGVETVVDLEEDGSVDGSSALAAASLSMSRTAVERYEAAAVDVARQALGSPTGRARAVPCVPAGPADESCARRFVLTFGQRAWRRPPTEEELLPLVRLAITVGRESGDAWLGLEMALSAMLQSPSFVYRAELGRPDPGRPGRLKLDDWELATRLSFFLLDTTPGDALLEAARRGALSPAGGLEAEARRILEDPRAPPVLARFFSEAMRLTELPKLQKSRSVFPRMSATLGAAMLEEVQRLFLHYAFRRPGSVLDLHDGREAFVNAELAGLYGMAAPRTAGFTQVAHPSAGPRAGLITSAGFLAEFAYIDKTSPAGRGKAIRENLLCGTVPAPPGDVSTELPPVPAGQRRTMRERLAAHSANPSCAGCHQLMDPLGLALESFDGIGMFRQADQGLPLDTSGVLDGASFKDAADLAGAIRRHPDLGVCLVRRLFRHAVGQLESSSAEPLIVEVARRFGAGGQRFAPLVVDLIASDLFRLAEAPRP